MTFEAIELLKVYHATISIVAAVGTVMTMDIVGREGTSAWQDRWLQHLQRAGLALLAIALFCSGLRVPAVAQCGFVALLSAAAVNSAIAWIIVPTALIGHSHTPRWH